MSTFWTTLLSWLVWLSADPAAINREAPKAAAAVAAARASMLPEAAPAPGPTPTACDCGSTCVRGIWKPDGKIEQRCACKCSRCVAERNKTSCVSGTCSTKSR